MFSTDTKQRTLELLRAVIDVSGTGGVPPLRSATDEQILQLAETLAYKYGILRRPEDGMADVTKTIGTTGRDYSTITAWEADLDNGAIYTSGDNAIGECYADADFDESVTINGGGTIGLTSIKLSAASGERHDGTAGTGVRNAYSGGIVNSIIGVAASGRATTVSWIEIDAGAATNPLWGIQDTVGANGSQVHAVLIHGGVRSSSGLSGSIDTPGSSSATFANVTNSILYDWLNSSSGGAAGINVNGNAFDGQVFNCSVYGIQAGTSGTAYGVRVQNDNDANKKVQNTVCAGLSGGSAQACFSPASPTTVVMDHNASDDTTASGTGSLTSITVADQFVSTTGGSEDFHLKTGADLIDAGTDLVTTPTNVNIDIDGRDRDAEGDTWDIGADEFVVVGGAANPKNVFGLALDGPLRRVVLQ